MQAERRQAPGQRGQAPACCVGVLLRSSGCKAGMREGRTGEVGGEEEELGHGAHADGPALLRLHSSGTRCSLEPQGAEPSKPAGCRQYIALGKAGS
jgi:hypothetical protein